MRIRKNDMVEVIAGKEKGKRGKVLMVFPAEDRAVVEKLNVVKRHTKPSGKKHQGGILEKEAKLHLSNLMLLCANCGKAMRIAIETLQDGKRLRKCKGCGEILDKR